MISNTNEGYWDHSKKITASDLAIGDEFGISVSIFDRYASVGAWKEEDTGEVDQGSAYLFNLGSPGTNDQFTLIYNSDTGRWSIGKVTASGGGGGSGLDSIIGTQAMINANTPDGAQLFWDATNQTWSIQIHLIFYQLVLQIKALQQQDQLGLQAGMAVIIN